MRKCFSGRFGFRINKYFETVWQEQQFEDETFEQVKTRTRRVGVMSLTTADYSAKTDYYSVLSNKNDGEDDSSSDDDSDSENNSGIEDGSGSRRSQRQKRDTVHGCDPPQPSDVHMT